METYLNCTSSSTWKLADPGSLVHLVPFYIKPVKRCQRAGTEVAPVVDMITRPA